MADSLSVVIGNPHAEVKHDDASGASWCAVVYIDFGRSGHLPVVIDRGFVIRDVLEWVADRKSRRISSDSTLRAYVTGIARFCDFVHFSDSRSFDGPLVTAFFEARVHGNRELGWGSVEISTAKRDIEVVALFLDWYTDRHGIPSANPRVDKVLSWGAFVAERARRYKSDLLFHLFNKTKRSQQKRIRKYLPSARAEIGIAPARHNPQKKFNFDDFLTLIKHEANPRDLLVWLLLGAGGLRVSEVAHLFTSDVTCNVSGQADILLTHPTYGRVDPALPGTRQQYLRTKYGCCPRDQLPMHHIAYAGFKGMRWQEGRTAGVTWLHPELGRRAWQAHVAYLTVRRSAPARHHPWYLVNTKHNSGAPLTLRNIAGLLQSACHRLSLRSPANPHALRHMYVHIIVNELGMELHDAQIVVRHINAESTAIYSQASAEAARRLLQALSGTLDLGDGWPNL